MQTTLLTEIQAYALAHYEDEFFWSTIVECYEDSELQALIDELGVKTLKGFIRAAAPAIDVLEDRRADARNSAF